MVSLKLEGPDCSKRNHSQADKWIEFDSSHLLHSEWTAAQCCQPFEQLGLGFNFVSITNLLANDASTFLLFLYCFGHRLFWYSELKETHNPLLRMCHLSNNCSFEIELKWWVLLHFGYSQIEIYQLSLLLHFFSDGKLGVAPRLCV